MTSDEDDDGVLTFAETGGLDPYGDCDGDCVPSYLDDDDEDNTVGNEDGAPEGFYDLDGNGVADFQSPNAIILVAGEASCTDGGGQLAGADEYFVIVNMVSGGAGGPYSVSVGSETAQNFTGTDLSFGPFAHSGTGSATQVVLATEAGSTGQTEVVETLCGVTTESGLNVNGVSCVLGISTVFVQADAGTFLAGGNTKLTQTYLLVNDQDVVVDRNNTGLFTPVALPGTYNVYALNYEVADEPAIAAATAPGMAIDEVVLGVDVFTPGSLNDLCYSLCGPEEVIVEECVLLYDLSLRKTISPGQASGFNPGNQVSFDITVFNFSDTTVYDVVVGDSLPTGLTYVNAAPTTQTGANVLTSGRGSTIDFVNNGDQTFTIDSLLTNDSITFQLAVTIDDVTISGPNRPLINRAEIQSFDDDMIAGNDAPEDEDSTPDTNFSNDAGGAPDSPADDFIDGDGTGMPNDTIALTDEDDADVALLPYYDVALTKVIDPVTLGANGTADEDEVIAFEITVVNQGNIPVSNVEVYDAIPCGFDFEDGDGVTVGNQAIAGNGDWTGDNTLGARTTIAGPIAVGESETVTINLRVRGTGEFDATCLASAERFVNRAEIASIDPDGPGGEAPFENDFDSNFNEDDDDEDGGGAPNGNSDNTVDGNGTAMQGTDDATTDDDDEDPAGTEVVDVALSKIVNEAGSADGAGGPYRAGDLIQFDIEVFNQGTQTLTNIDVVDVLPVGLDYEATAGDGSWSYDGSSRTASTTIAGPLVGGASDLVTIFARVLTASGDQRAAYTNVAEVAEIDAEVTDFTTNTTVTRTLTQDADSPLNGDVTDNTGGMPETDDDDNLMGGGPSRGEDQDNADPAFVEVAGITLGSTVFLDNDNDGVQNGTDAGLPGVEIQLFTVRADGSEMLVAVGPDGIVDSGDEGAPFVTDANGNYLFANLVPGDYFITLPTAPASAPISSNASSSGYVEMDPDDNTDGNDDGLQPGGSGGAITSGIISLQPGEEPTAATGEDGQGSGQDENVVLGYTDENGNMTLDIGVFAPVSVGDTAFVDVNDNGIQDGGDLPLPMVTVTIFSADGSPVTAAADGSAYDNETITDDQGSYNFDNLAPGDYYVIFDLATSPAADIYTIVDANVGDDDTDDSDVDPATGRSENTGSLPSGTAFPDLDLGVRCAIEVVVAAPSTICATQTVELPGGAAITPASLGGVWSSSGDGTFVDAAGNELAGPQIDFAVAAGYRPGAADRAAGAVTLTLTTNDPPAGSGCAAVRATVEINVLKVDCGAFFWDGRD